MADSSATDLNPEYNNDGFAATDNNNTTQIHATPESREGFLDQTFGEVLQTNPQAQQLIMQSMGLTPEKFQEMLNSAKDNNMMHMKIRDLLNNDQVQQAVMQQQGSSEQLQQTVDGNGAIVTPTQQKTSFLDTLRSWFK